MSESKPNPGHDPDDEIELGREVVTRTNKTRGAVIGVRVSPDLFARLNEYANVRGLTISDVVRKGAEQLVAGAVPAGPVYLTGATIIGSGLVNGSPTASTGRSQVRDAKEGHSYAGKKA